MSLEATCQGCGDTFEARNTKAKWCSDRCRKAAKQAETAADAPETDPIHEGLVASVQRELDEAGRTDTFAGQLALTLARRLPKPDESGISSLSKELRTVMAAALEGVTPPSAEGPAEERGPAEDEVTRARRQREEARQAAGLG